MNRLVCVCVCVCACVCVCVFATLRVCACGTWARRNTHGSSITLDEFIKLMHRGHNGPGDPTDVMEEGEMIALFQEMDVDGDGSVDYHEFAEVWAFEKGYVAEDAH